VRASHAFNGPVGSRGLLMHRPFVARWHWPFKNFNLIIVHMLDDLGEVAHIEPL
jgi:hypothetical protein